MAEIEKETTSTTVGDRVNVSVTKERKLSLKKEENGDLDKAAKQIEGLKKQIEGLSEPAGTAASKIGGLKDALIEMNTALDILIEKVKSGAIKSFEELGEAINSATKAIPQMTSEIKNAHKQIAGILGTKGEETEAVEQWQKSMAKKIGDEIVPALLKYYENLGGISDALASRAGRQIGTEGAFEGGGWPKEFDPIPKDEGEWDGWMKETKRRLGSRIAAIEVQDKAFGESWRDTWPMESLLSNLYVGSEGKPKLREFQRKLRTEYEDRRRVHDYFWMYQRCSGVEAILNMSAVLQKSAIERMVQREGVGEAMFKMQGMVVKWDKLKEKRNMADKADDKEKSKECQDEMNEISDRIKRFGRGSKEELIGEDKREEEDPEGESRRIAARMMVILGLCAQYNYTEFGGAGDFFLGRLMNLREYIMNDVAPGRRWQYRDKIMAGFKQYLYFSSPLTDQSWKPSPDKKHSAELKKKVGIEQIEEKIEGTTDKRKLAKIISAEALRNFEIVNERREYWLGGAEFADAAFKADKGRVGLRNTGAFLDSPTEKLFYKLLVEDMEHLNGRARWEFFHEFVGGVIDFYKDEGGVIRRLAAGKLTTTFKYKDKDGKEKSYFTFAQSDAMRIGIPEAWDSSNIDGFISRLQKEAPATLGPLAEHLKREKIKFLGFPGIGPIRGLKEFSDEIKKNWLWALLAMLMEAVKSGLPEELELGGKKKR